MTILRVMEMKKLGFIMLACSLVLTACGQRSESDPDSGIPVIDADGNVVGSVDLVVSARTSAAALVTGGDETATITVTVKDTESRQVSTQPVEFTATGGLLQDISPATDERGIATATLTLAGDNRAQDIIVTARSGDVSDTVLINAIGTELTSSSDDGVLVGQPLDVTYKLKAGNGDPIANETITFSSAAGNSVNVKDRPPGTIPVTDTDGAVTVVVGSEAGADTITASALEGTIVNTRPFLVSNDQLDFVGIQPNTDFNVGANYQVSVVWLSQGSPVVGQSLRFSITAGSISSQPVVTTDAQGRASVTFSSNSAGESEIKVEAVGQPEVTESLELAFVATTPAQLDISSSLSRVSTNSKAEVVARVTDNNGNPVKGAEVLFASNDLKGGQLTPSTRSTDTRGEATIDFSAGSIPTEINEIAITATVNGTAIADSLNLTVVQQQLNVTMGTSRLLSSIGADTQYAVNFVVQVADGSGSPLNDANVLMSIKPLDYRKGRMVPLADENSGIFLGWGPVGTDGAGLPVQGGIVCPSEDLNGNRVLDPGEDTNSNGVLDPQDPSSLAEIGTPGLATIQNGIVTTDENGQGYFQLRYPKSSAQWSRVEITARAQKFGAEAVTTFTLVLDVLAEDVDETDEIPPNLFSPYGNSAICTDTL